MDLAVICADIGCVKQGNFAWYDSSGASGDRPSALASRVADLLNVGDVPLRWASSARWFVPLPEDEISLGGGRPGDGSRPWSAGAGCGALTTGLVQVAWVLRSVREQLAQPTPAFLDWDPFVSERRGVFLWEAFVSGKVKGLDHIDDATLAVRAFEHSLPDPASVNAVVCQSEVYSLVGAALLRSGWASSVALLSQPCLVVEGGVALGSIVQGRVANCCHRNRYLLAGRVAWSHD